MDVFLMIRRAKTSIFTDAKETTPLFHVKRVVEGIFKIAPENQRLYWQDQLMTDDDKCLGAYGVGKDYTSIPVTLGLTYRKDDGEWEKLSIADVTCPPPLHESLTSREIAPTTNPSRPSPLHESSNPKEEAPTTKQEKASWS